LIRTHLRALVNPELQPPLNAIAVIDGFQFRKTILAFRFRFAKEELAPDDR
jgi:hypothetical protein